MWRVAVVLVGVLIIYIIVKIVPWAAATLITKLIVLQVILIVLATLGNRPEILEGIDASTVVLIICFDALIEEMRKRQ